MGIHCDWMKIFKEHCPPAFTKETEFTPNAGFIDGQIQLMKSKGIISWDQFVQYQFVNPVRRLLRERGAKVVVVAFDNYAHVPMAKGMTQAKRAKKAAPSAFHERAQLPDMIPANWDSIIMNRTFKMRVIQMVVSRLPALVHLAAGEQLIIDYMGPPVSHSHTGEQTVLEDMEAIGEADLKFFRYAEMFQKLLVMATDSDYLPIAMLRLHTQFEGREPPQVVLLRLCVSLPVKKKKGAPKSGAPKSGAPARREREFVDVNRLLRSLVALFDRVAARRAGCEAGPHTQRLFMHVLCALIAVFGGTDFTRPMPWAGPRRVWDALGSLFPALLSSMDQNTRQIDPPAFVHSVVGQVYMRTFAAHMAGVTSRRDVATVLSALQKSKLADSTKLHMPSVEFVDTSVRNANWVLLYWSGVFVPELSGDFGYKQVGHKVQYSDV